MKAQNPARPPRHDRHEGPTAPRPREPSARIGISGWNYPPWRGVFYPKGLKHADELRFASDRFTSIEINGSFYSLQRPSSYQRWYQQTPDDFVFSVKGGRFITHMKRLKGVESALANFFASGPLCLAEKLGPILWQLPPSFAFDSGRLQAFFELLPRTGAEAAKLAAQHEPWLEGRTSVVAKGVGALRHALEIRHESFLSVESLRLLERHSIAVCVADSAGVFPKLDAVTADFVYVRLHGSKRLYTSGYSNKELTAWANDCQRWLSMGRDVYVYFDNDVKVRAPFDAENLQRILSGAAPRRKPRTLATVQEEPRTTWEVWNRSAARKP